MNATICGLDVGGGGARGVSVDSDSLDWESGGGSHRLGIVEAISAGSAVVDVLDRHVRLETAIGI